VSAARILHAPFDVGGHAHQLSLAERELGLHSEVAVFAPQPYGFESDIDLRAGIDVALPLRIARRAAFLREALGRYDVFHFNFGQTLLQVRQLGRVADELPLLKRRGKTVLVTFQGCDVRPFARCHCRNRACARLTHLRAPAAARALRYADRVLHLNPDLGRELPGSRFLPYANVDPRAHEPNPPDPAGTGELVIAHAPTDRDVKGTAHVVRAGLGQQADGGGDVVGRQHAVAVDADHDGMPGRLDRRVEGGGRTARRVGHGVHAGVFRDELGGDLVRAVRRRTEGDHDLHLAGVLLREDRLDGSAQMPLLVEDGHDHRNGGEPHVGLGVHRGLTLPRTGDTTAPRPGRCRSSQIVWAYGAQDPSFGCSSRRCPPMPVTPPRPGRRSADRA